MYDRLRENFPLQEETFSPDDWLHVSGWNKFYANLRGYNYVSVHTDAEDNEYVSNQDNIPGLTFKGFREYEDDYCVLQNDRFETASDNVVGINNGISVALAIALLFEEFNVYTSLLFGFVSAIVQNSLRVLFNSYEYANSANRNHNKLLKVMLAVTYTVASVAGLILLLAGTQAIIESLPLIAFAISVARIVVNLVYMTANLTLAAIATNPFDRERYLNQAYKRGIQAIGAVGLSVVTGLILFKSVTATAISAPVKLSLAILSIGAMLYSAAREIPLVRTWQPLRYIFKDVNTRLDELSTALNEKNINERIKFYRKCITDRTSPLNSETTTEKLFYHGGGMIEELTTIRDCDFYKVTRETIRNLTPSPDQKTAAQLFLQGILTVKIVENEKEAAVLEKKSDFRFFRKSDTTNNTYKKQFFDFLLWYVGDRKTSLPDNNTFKDIKTLTELQNFLSKDNTIRLAVFYAAFRKHSNTEAIWRAIIKYEELFEKPQAILIRTKKYEEPQKIQGQEYVALSTVDSKSAMTDKETDSTGNITPCPSTGTVSSMERTSDNVGAGLDGPPVVVAGQKH